MVTTCNKNNLPHKNSFYSISLYTILQHICFLSALFQLIMVFYVVKHISRLISTQKNVLTLNLIIAKSEILKIIGL